MATTIYASSWTGSATTGKVTQRAYMTYTVTVNNATTYTVVVNASGIQQWNGTWTKIGVTCGLTSQSNVSKTLTKSSGSNYLHAFFSSKTYSYTKTHASQSKSISGTSKITSGVDKAHGSGTVLNKTSTVTLSFTVPPKDNYAVTYNANGGTGAPASQTKWYGEDLKLQSDVPTRSGYVFMGWATSETATSPTYQPSDTYTGNSRLELYAVWKSLILVKINDNWVSGEASVKGSGVWHGVDAIFVKVNSQWIET